MWWVTDSVVGGNFTGFFDANIFFPYYRTLAYSEFLIPQALVGAPIMLLSGNPLLAYNVVLLLSFIATAFAIYLLGRCLTGSSVAGFVAGLALAFSPFLFHHLGQIQVIGAAGIPLAFLFLHRYFDGGKLKYLLGFTAAYVGQALGNAYYAVYLTYAAGAYILYRGVLDRHLTQRAFWRDMGIHAVLSVAVLAPFYRQYLILRTDLGFVRPLSYEGGLYSYLATAPVNRLFGSVSSRFLADEAMFPGITVVALALLGLFASRNREQAGTETPREKDGGGERAYRIAGLLIAVGWLLVVALALTGGFEVSVLGVRISAHRSTNPLIGLMALIAFRAGLRWRYPGLGQGASWFRDPQRFYVWMLAASMLLSLGTADPYRLLYDYVPGFDGIRAPGRIHIMTIFWLAVFAAYGTQALLSRLSAHRQVAAAVLLPALICVEFFSVPLPLVTVPGRALFRRCMCGLPNRKVISPPSSTRSTALPSISASISQCFIPRRSSTGPAATTRRSTTRCGAAMIGFRRRLRSTTFGASGCTGSSSIRACTEAGGRRSRLCSRGTWLISIWLRTSTTPWSTRCAAASGSTARRSTCGWPTRMPAGHPRPGTVGPSRPSPTIISRASPSMATCRRAGSPPTRNRATVSRSTWGASKQWTASLWCSIGTCPTTRAVTGWKISEDGVQ